MDERISNLKGKKIKYGEKNQQGSRDSKATTTIKKQKQWTNKQKQPTSKPNKQKVYKWENQIKTIQSEPQASCHSMGTVLIPAQVWFFCTRLGQSTFQWAALIELWWLTTIFDSSSREIHALFWSPLELHAPWERSIRCKVLGARKWPY